MTTQKAPALPALTEPPTLEEVIDALNVFNKPRGDEPVWAADDAIHVKALPQFIHDVCRAWYGPRALTDEQILNLWSPRLDSEVQRPILGKNKILAFARAVVTLAAKEPALPPDEPVAKIVVNPRVHGGSRFPVLMSAGLDLPADTLLYARAALPAWQPIETAPRDSSRLLVASYSENTGEWRVREAWWRMPYEGAAPDRCWWCYEGNGTLLDKSIHGLGASHWMPLPAAPDVNGAER